jgi:N-acetylmuramoyl-L-alanine amidase
VGDGVRDGRQTGLTARPVRQNGAVTSLFATVAVLISIALAGSDAQLAASTNDLTSLKGKTILVDPGHNGGNAAHPEIINKKVPAGGFKKECDTTGTATNDESLSEPAFNWDTAKRLRKLLQAEGAKVVFTRKNNTGVGPCINKRAAIGNKAKADAAISIHADGAAASGHGFHVIYPGLVKGYTEPILKPSRKLALKVRAALDAQKLTRSTYTGKKGLDKRTDLGGLNLSKVPKVLVELGNMRNASDANDLKSKAWREQTARSLRDALAAYLQ